MKLYSCYVPFAQYRLHLAVACLAFALMASGLKAQTWDLSAGFSAASNPNDPWSYGWTESIGGSFTALTVPWVSTADGSEQVPSWQLTSYQTPAVYKNTAGATISVGGGAASIPAETVWYYPGEDGRSENYGVIRFTVPYGLGGGTYNMEVQVDPVYPSSPQGDTDFHVVINGTEVFGVFLDPDQSASWSVSIIGFQDGDTLDFVIGRGDDGSQYGSGLRIDATIGRFVQ